ncbi:unnamed protein product [Mucor hiemalis]
MIIASPAKKEISIPLQPMTSAVSSLSLFEAEEAEAVDLVSVKSRSKGQQDFVVQVFGQTSLFNVQVEETLSITTTHSIDKSNRTLTCEAFIHDNTVFSVPRLWELMLVY